MKNQSKSTSPLTSGPEIKLLLFRRIYAGMRKSPKLLCCKPCVEERREEGQGRYSSNGGPNKTNPITT